MRTQCRRQRPYRFLKIILISNGRDNKLVNLFPFFKKTYSLCKIVVTFCCGGDSKIVPSNLFFSLSLIIKSHLLIEKELNIFWIYSLTKKALSQFVISVENPTKICQPFPGWASYFCYSHYSHWTCPEHHSIDCGYFVVFKYEVVSNFVVSVFDMSACEIRYPCNPSNGPYHGKHPSVHPKEEMKDDVSVEIFDSSSSPLQPPTAFRDGVSDKCSGHNTCKRGSNPFGIKKKGSFRERKKHKMEDHAARMLKLANPSFTAIIKSYNNSLGQSLSLFLSILMCIHF